ncbi:MAG: hypothetical protein KKF98_16935 [Bacteroidetes bacterium]|nr:hypothetical protein [Bacteroidota bacterium]
MGYLIERLGDIHGKTYHQSFEEALTQLRKEYPNQIGIREAIARLIVGGVDPLERATPYQPAYDTADSIIAYLEEEGIDIEEFPTTPDPEDDRILIWEFQSDGSAKVVWHFSGWHWDADEFGLPQGQLPGDNESLYKLACDD